MRTEVTYLERSPYLISSLVSLSIGGDDEPADAAGAGVWAAASGARAPTVKPLASAALPFRNSRRAGRFQAIGLSLTSPREERVLARKYTPVGKARAGGGLVFGRPLHAVDHEGVDRSTRRAQREPQLRLQRFKKARRQLVLRDRGRDGVRYHGPLERQIK